ncbi:uncharacterized protein LOC122249683 isoform X2 [Penaeus japonicus]|uniref:uncharacterized protein LOC122249683 isoform X2 n=1 Tax=Penaeus japonicus TaxID=27405 RepID=UPI001C70D91F|nr:uncharacterized protein LOC122249683 isoform X2 [Penaeus japonicus]XP_042866691.1 uncharacterized protein LOC122249683 isoform X2 [Penaeus japonicus]
MDKTKAPPHIISPTEKRKWNIEYVEPYGRCTIATRDISEGEVLFVDHPVITGPKQNSELMCLGCYRQLESWDSYKCSKWVPAVVLNVLGFCDVVL